MAFFNETSDDCFHIGTGAMTKREANDFIANFSEVGLEPSNCWLPEGFMQRERPSSTIY